MAVRADISQAVAAVSTLEGYLARLHGRGIVLTVAQQNSANKLLGMGKAEGGYINGIGSGTSDSNLTPTSHGEYVVKAASVAQVGRGFMDQVNFGRVPVTTQAPATSTAIFNAYGLDADKAVQTAMRQWEFSVVPR